MLTELNAGTSSYLHRKVNKDISFKYALVAVNSEGKESLPAHVEILCFGLPAFTKIIPIGVKQECQKNEDNDPHLFFTFWGEEGGTCLWKSMLLHINSFHFFLPSS